MMQQDDAFVAALLRRVGQARSIRGTWEQHWRDVRDLVRPNTLAFGGTESSGQSLTSRIYDGTAIWALTQFASGLASFLTSPHERWFQLWLANVPQDARLDSATRRWLQLISDTIYSCYSDPRSNFTMSMHECYLDIGAFGTDVLYQEWNRENRHLHFKAMPLSSCYLWENHLGQIDGIGMCCRMSLRQCEQEFGKDNLPQPMREHENPDKEYTIHHIIFPREERDIRKWTPENKPFASIWLVEEHKAIVRNSGFDKFPFHVARWSKITGETYGRSPAIDCLPDIRMLNQMAKTNIKAAQKIVDPPLIAPNDGFILPIHTTPGAIIFKEPGTEKIEALETRGRPDIGEEQMNHKRLMIIRAFFVDYLIQEQKKERMTTLEVADQREQRFRMMGPMLGRMQSEKLGPMLSYSYYLLRREGILPPPPASIRGRPLEVIYTSPAARAQNSQKAQAIQGFVQDLETVANFDPGVLDVIDTDQVAVEMASIRDVPRSVVRDPEQIAARRKARAEQAASAQQAEQAATMAGAAKDYAQARKVRGETV